jgi:CID domain
VSPAGIFENILTEGLILVKIEARLTLFYLANDVIQHSKRKGYEFVDSWGTSLQKATTLVRDDKVKEKISRIFNIWEQREVYSEDFIADLNGLLAINPAKKTPSNASVSSTRSHSPVAPQQTRTEDFEEEFQLTGVVSNIRNCVSLESETDKNLKIVVKTNVPDMEKTRTNLKGWTICVKNHDSSELIVFFAFPDRTHVDEVERDLETASTKYEQFISSLNAEIAARKILLTALDQADRFYRNQR